MLVNLFSTAPYIKAGRLRGLAVTSAERDPLVPDVPTALEVGLPEIEATNWSGFVVPAGTPKDIVTSLNREIVRGMARADIKERLAALGFEPVASTPEDMAKQIKVEVEIWGKVIRAANIKAG